MPKLAPVRNQHDSNVGASLLAMRCFDGSTGNREQARSYESVRLECNMELKNCQRGRRRDIYLLPDFALTTRSCGLIAELYSGTQRLRSRRTSSSGRSRCFSGLS